MQGTTPIILACAALHKLSQLYDSAGESGRTVRAQLIEAALFVGPTKLPQVMIPREDYLSQLEMELSGARLLTIEMSSFVSELSLENYLSWVVVLVKEEAETSIVKKNLLRAASAHLWAEHRVRLFRKAGISFNADELVAEGRRRSS